MRCNDAECGAGALSGSAAHPCFDQRGRAAAVVGERERDSSFVGGCVARHIGSGDFGARHLVWSHQHNCCRDARSSVAVCLSLGDQFGIVELDNDDDNDNDSDDGDDRDDLRNVKAGTDDVDFVDFWHVARSAFDNTDSNDVVTASDDRNAVVVRCCCARRLGRGRRRRRCDWRVFLCAGGRSRLPVSTLQACQEHRRRFDVSRVKDLSRSLELVCKLGRQFRVARRQTQRVQCIQSDARQTRSERSSAASSSGRRRCEQRQSVLRLDHPLAPLIDDSASFRRLGKPVRPRIQQHLHRKVPCTLIAVGVVGQLKRPLVPCKSHLVVASSTRKATAATAATAAASPAATAKAVATATTTTPHRVRRRRQRWQHGLLFAEFERKKVFAHGGCAQRLCCFNRLVPSPLLLVGGKIPVFCRIRSQRPHGRRMFGLR